MFELLSSCRALCESLEELALLFVVSSHKLFMELLKEEERKVLVEQMRKRSATINLSAKPLPSFYDIPGAALTICRTCLRLRVCWLSTGHLPAASDLSLLNGMFQSLKAGDLMGFGSSPRSFCEREHWAAGAAAHPPTGAA